MSRSQLAPGVEVVAVPGRGLAIRTADGEFLSVRTGHADEDALLSRLSGAATGGPDAEPDAELEAEPDAEPDAELDRLVGAFKDAGYLAQGPRRAQWPVERREVLLLGEPWLTEPLAAYLRAAGAEPRPAAPGDVAGTAAEWLRRPEEPRPAAVVWCLDGPVPAGLWDAADRLPERGIAWLRCHREGWQAYVEPLAAVVGDVTSAHVRARRLAATPAHRELDAYWSGPRTSGAPVHLTPPAAGLLAALLADDLTRWATDAPDAGELPARRRLRRIDLRTLTVTEHAVLPVPDVAAIPKRAVPEQAVPEQAVPEHAVRSARDAAATPGTTGTECPVPPAPDVAAIPKRAVPDVAATPKRAVPDVAAIPKKAVIPGNVALPGNAG